MSDEWERRPQPRRLKAQLLPHSGYGQQDLMRFLNPKQTRKVFSEPENPFFVQ